jgi:hypothetical protein
MLFLTRIRSASLAFLGALAATLTVATTIAPSAALAQID